MDIREILKKEGISEQNALRDQAIMVAMSKISHFEAICHKFEQKYGEDFQHFKRANDRKKETEDFKMEDDLLDWEFADSSLKWWKNAIRETRSAAYDT